MFCDFLLKSFKYFLSSKHMHKYFSYQFSLKTQFSFVRGKNFSSRFVSSLINFHLKNDRSLSTATGFALEKSLFLFSFEEEKTSQ